MMHMRRRRRAILLSCSSYDPSILWNYSWDYF